MSNTGTLEIIELDEDMLDDVVCSARQHGDRPATHLFVHDVAIDHFACASCAEDVKHHRENVLGQDVFKMYCLCCEDAPVPIDARTVQILPIK